MTIKFKYEMFQEVGIADLNDYPAKVIEIHLVGKNTYYMLEYWHDMEIKTVLLYEDDITEKANNIYRDRKDGIKI